MHFCDALCLIVKDIKYIFQAGELFKLQHWQNFFVGRRACSDVHERLLGSVELIYVEQMSCLVCGYTLLSRHVAD